MAPRRRHTEQIIRKLREADRLLGEGQDVGAVAEHLEVSEQTLHRWRLQYGGLKADDAKRLKELERQFVVVDERMEKLNFSLVSHLSLIEKPSTQPRKKPPS